MMRVGSGGVKVSVVWKYHQLMVSCIGVRYLVSEVYFRRCHCGGERPGLRVDSAPNTRLSNYVVVFGDDSKECDPLRVRWRAAAYIQYQVIWTSVTVREKYWKFRLSQHLVDSPTFEVFSSQSVRLARTAKTVLLSSNTAMPDERIADFQRRERMERNCNPSILKVALRVKPRAELHKACSTRSASYSSNLGLRFLVFYPTSNEHVS
jgi:hypothetical protein